MAGIGSWLQDGKRQAPKPEPPTRRTFKPKLLGTFGVASKEESAELERLSQHVVHVSRRGTAGQL
jgi:hypothetical protein